MTASRDDMSAADGEALDPRAELRRIEDKMIRRVDALCVFARQGCEQVVVEYEKFIQTRDRLNAAAGNDRAFLGDDELMSTAHAYDLLHPKRNRTPLFLLELKRTLLQTFID